MHKDEEIARLKNELHILEQTNDLQRIELDEALVAKGQAIGENAGLVKGFKIGFDTGILALHQLYPAYIYSEDNSQNVPEEEKRRIFERLNNKKP